MNSFVVIDKNLNSRIAFGVATEEISGEIDFYPLEYIDEAITIPNTLIQVIPDMIFLNLDTPGNNGLDDIRKLKNVEQYKDVPVIVYSDFKIDAGMVEYLGASHCFHLPKKINGLVKVISPILKGNNLPVCLCDVKV